MDWNRVALAKKQNGLPEPQGGRRHRTVSVVLIGLHEQLILFLIRWGESSVLWKSFL